MAYEAQSGESFEGSSNFPGVGKLCLQWRSARRHDDLPFYEDVALGSLGAMADDIALVQPSPDGTFVILRAGTGVVKQLGRPLDTLAVTQLDANYRDALTRGLGRALACHEPTLTLARNVSNGMVATCEILALPLRNRWGGDLILAYIKQRPATHNLVEAIYRSTQEGLLALAALPSVVEGEPNDFQIVSLNGGAAAMFGKPDHLIRWKLLSELIPEAIAGDLYGRLGCAFRQQTPQQFELDLGGGGKEPKYFRVSVAPVGDLLGITLTDITGIRLREDSVKLLFEGNPISLLLYDRETLEIVRVNDAMVERYGYSREALQAMTVPDLHPLAERDRARECARTLGPQTEGKRPWKHVTADGSVRDVQTYSREISFAGRGCILASIVDVTDQQRAQARVVFMAHHDHLTSLANRVLFRSELDQALAECRGGPQGLFVHSIDLDYFKQVNDTLGHSAGDEVLREVAARIVAAVRPHDLVARLGGDEFVVVQFGAERREEAAVVATRIIERLSASYAVGDRRIVLGASIGIAAAPGDATETDALLKSADVALYRAKAEGRGTYRFFEAEMDEPVRARRHLETELRGALDAGQFTLYYQPILDAATETVVGCEALLRWFHPTLGTVPPARFIPLAEDLGIISALGDWVLQEACAEAARWPDTVNVAVNLSPAQFAGGGLAASVARHLATSGLAPHRLELEITESVFLVESDANLGILRQLQDLGVTISLDDFGTGYSSLSYLRSFPVGKIKIDRSFVRDLAESPGCLAIVRAVTRLGESLGIATLAEGVETKEQFLRLRAEGCGQVQGFLFGGPVAASEIRDLFVARRETERAA